MNRRDVPRLTHSPCSRRTVESRMADILATQMLVERTLAFIDRRAHELAKQERRH